MNALRVVSAQCAIENETRYCINWIDEEVLVRKSRNVHSWSASAILVHLVVFTAVRVSTNSTEQSVAWIPIQWEVRAILGVVGVVASIWCRVRSVFAEECVL